MAISTQGVTLKWGTTAINVAKVVDIKNFPDLGGAPELLETTTLTDAAQAFINGIQSQGAMEFTCNYTRADYVAVMSNAGANLFYELDFGTEGVFAWRGEHTAWVVGAGVNAVTEMVVSIAPSTRPTLKTP